MSSEKSEEEKGKSCDEIAELTKFSPRKHFFSHPPTQPNL